TAANRGAPARASPGAARGAARSAAAGRPGTGSPGAVRPDGTRALSVIREGLGDETRALRSILEHVREPHFIPHPLHARHGERETRRVAQAERVEPLRLAPAHVAGRRPALGIGVLVMLAQELHLLIATALHRIAYRIPCQRHVTCRCAGRRAAPRQTLPSSDGSAASRCHRFPRRHGALRPGSSPTPPGSKADSAAPMVRRPPWPPVPAAAAADRRAIVRERVAAGVPAAWWLRPYPCETRESERMRQQRPDTSKHDARPERAPAAIQRGSVARPVRGSYVLPAGRTCMTMPVSPSTGAPGGVMVAWRASYTTAALSPRTVHVPSGSTSNAVDSSMPTPRWRGSSSTTLMSRLCRRRRRKC